MSDKKDTDPKVAMTEPAVEEEPEPAPEPAEEQPMEVKEEAVEAEGGQAEVAAPMVYEFVRDVREGERERQEAEGQKWTSSRREGEREGAQSYRQPTSTRRMREEEEEVKRLGARERALRAELDTCRRKKDELTRKKSRPKVAQNPVRNAPHISVPPWPPWPEGGRKTEIQCKEVF